MNIIEKKKVMSDRVYYLDSLRGVLMMLVVFYHSSLVFNPTYQWAIHSSSSSILALYMGNLISAFQMPAFFIISGYFVLFTIIKYGPDVFIRVRSKRILVPLFSTAFTLNVIQAILVKGSDWQTYYFDKGWISHLWFLWNLVFYFLFVYIIFKLVSKKYLNIIKKTEAILFKLPIFLLMFILPAFGIALLVIGKLLPSSMLGIESSTIIYYFPFFLFGMLLSRNENLLSKFAGINPSMSILVSIVAYIAYAYFSGYTGSIWLAISLYFKLLLGWFSSAACFYIFLKYFNRPSKFFYFLSDASYSVYLFQQVLVIGFGLILINLNIGGVFGLILLITSVLIVSILIHILFISKIKVLKLLYNGQ